MNENTMNAMIEYLFAELMEQKRLVNVYRDQMESHWEDEGKYEKKIMELEDKIDEQAEHIEWLESLVNREKRNTEVMGEALEDSYGIVYHDNAPLAYAFAKISDHFAPSTSHEEEKIAKKWNDAIDEALNDHDGEGI